ncbi:MAG: hypothetical protein JWO36_2433 [Myxococcales bacterium]|nr:hypothetical protein [Myxococcales bacterium]
MKTGFLLVLLSACSFRHGDAGPGDAQMIDATMTHLDGGVAARSQRELVGGAGRTKAGAITIDVEIGHGIAVKKSTAGTHTIEGAPVVRP